MVIAAPRSNPSPRGENSTGMGETEAPGTTQKRSHIPITSAGIWGRHPGVSRGPGRTPRLAAVPRQQGRVRQRRGGSCSHGSSTGRG